jgi:putative redox protein
MWRGRGRGYEWGMSFTATARIVPGTLRSEVLVRNRFRLLTDEPPEAGGDDSAPTPYELLAAALAACVATTISMYARRKEWELGDVEVNTEHDPSTTPERFVVDVRLGGELDDEQLERLEKVAAACAVRHSLERDVVIEERLVAGARV